MASIEERRLQFTVRRYATVAAVLWSALLGLSLWWNLDRQHGITFEMALNTARSAHSKDQAYRLWASSHGGVYVPPTEKTPPSPWLAHIPDRDVVTLGGERLTLMNPAYMLRQMMQDYDELYGIKGRIVGIIYLNPNNQADPWEADAIRRFAAGEATEKFEIADIDGKPYLRFIRPFPMEEACQKCHGHLGFKNGEVRGAVGVSVPMEPYQRIELRAIRSLEASHAGVWLIGMAGIVLIGRKTSHRLMEKVRAERVLNERTEALERSNADLEQFAWVASHDLREPLRMISNYIALIERRYGRGFDADGHEFIGYVREGAVRMDQMVLDLLDFSRAGQSDEPFTPVALDEVIQTATANLALLIRETGASIGASAAFPIVIGSRDALIRLVQNLLENALKYRDPARTPRITIDVRAEEGEWIVSVADNGIGIAPEFFDKIFSIFQRLHTREKYEGTGIGLAICKRTVQRHGGRIWVESVAGAGTTFFFTLPKADAPR